MADSQHSGSVIFGVTGSFPFIYNAFAAGVYEASYVDSFNSGTVLLYTVTASVAEASASLTNLPMSTAGIDAYRDGVSIRSDLQRYASVRPVFWTGDASHEVKQITFGHSNYLKSNVSSFSDGRTRLNISGVVAHFYSGTVPVSQFFSPEAGDDDDWEGYDGIVEPLEIRSTIPGLSTVNPRWPRYTTVPVHTVGGSVSECGSTDDGGVIQQFYTVGRNRRFRTPFVEMGPTSSISMPTYTSSDGHTSGSVVRRAGIVLSPDVLIVSGATAFDDSSYMSARIPNTFIGSMSMGYQSQVMTPDRRRFVDAYIAKTSGSTDVEEFKHRRFTGTGFQYHGSRFGTDSIAFGGLMRYLRPQKEVT